MSKDCDDVEKVEMTVHLTIDVGPHLSHLLKRVFPKGPNQQAEVDALTDTLKESETALVDAVDNNSELIKE